MARAAAADLALGGEAAAAGEDRRPADVVGASLQVATVSFVDRGARRFGQHIRDVLSRGHLAVLNLSLSLSLFHPFHAAAIMARHAVRHGTSVR